MDIQTWSRSWSVIRDSWLVKDMVGFRQPIFIVRCRARAFGSLRAMTNHDCHSDYHGPKIGLQFFNPEPKHHIVYRCEFFISKGARFPFLMRAHLHEPRTTIHESRFSRSDSIRKRENDYFFPQSSFSFFAVSVAMAIILSHSGLICGMSFSWVPLALISVLPGRSHALATSCCPSSERR